jgi:hypothetical protein
VRGDKRWILAEYPHGLEEVSNSHYSLQGRQATSFTSAKTTRLFNLEFDFRLEVFCEDSIAFSSLDHLSMKQ